MKTHTGIKYDEIVSLVPSPFHARLTDANDIRLGSLRLNDSMHIDLKVLPQTRQLIAGCGAARICRDEQHPFPLSLEVPSEFAAGCRLSCTLEPNHHHDSGRIRGQCHAGSLPPHHLPQLLPHNLHDLMARS